VDFPKAAVDPCPTTLAQLVMRPWVCLAVSQGFGRRQGSSNGWDENRSLAKRAQDWCSLPNKAGAYAEGMKIPADDLATCHVRDSLAVRV